MNEDREMRLQDLLEEYDFSDDTKPDQSIAISDAKGDNSKTEGNKVNQTSTEEGETTVYESQPLTPETHSPIPRMEQSTPTPDFAEPVEAVAHQEHCAVG